MNIEAKIRNRSSCQGDAYEAIIRFTQGLKYRTPDSSGKSSADEHLTVYFQLCFSVGAWEGEGGLTLN